MNKILKSLFILLIPSALFAASNITPPTSFAGVDYSHIATEIDDNHAADAQDMIGDLYGAASKRRGTLRYISQAISTNPINSIYRATVDQGTGTYRAIIATTWDRIYASTGGVFPQWTLLKKDLVTANQRFSFATINGKVVMTGDALTDPIFQYDITTSSFGVLLEVGGSTDSVRLRAKYLFATNNYLLLGNVKDVKDEALLSNTTYYPSTIYYSLFMQPSSFTYSRSINVRTKDGEAITGFSAKNGNIEIYKNSSITQLSFSILNLTGLGGDITLTDIIDGFGCVAPGTIVNMGYYDAFLSKAGIVFWNGFPKNIYITTDQLKQVDLKIKPIIEKIFRENTYANAQMRYYKKKKWLVFSYEDPYKTPHGVPNSTLIYDLRTEEWWPWTLQANCFETMDAVGDDGSLLYGDNGDGYVYLADQETQLDDARKELPIDSMDLATNWTGGVADYTTVTEGTASWKIAMNGNSSSTIRQGMIFLSEWADKSKVTTDDKIDFKLFVTTIANLTNLRVDLQVGVTIQAFDDFFTSVTFTSATFVASSGTWTEFSIPISSFPIPSNWSDATVQLSPFARCITYYGIRFISTSIGGCSVNIDDLRLVQATHSPIKAFYLTKQFNLNSPSNKDYRQVILTRDKYANSNLNVEVYGDFGEFSNVKIEQQAIPKEILIFGLDGSTGIVKVKSTDFSIINSTIVADFNTKDYENGLADANFVYTFDKVKNNLVMLTRASMTVIVSTYGTLGSGTTNFNTVNQMAMGNDTLYLTDVFNNRLMKFRRKDLAYLGSYGDLGVGATQFMSPSGITVDDRNVWVFDDGNFKIIDLSISTFGFILSRSIDSNTLGEGVLQNDDKYVYDSFNRVSDFAYFQDVILEKRNKLDLSIVQQVKIRPKNVTALSTYTISGDFCLLGPYIFIGFTKDLATTGTYYIQKRMKDTFALVAEYSSPRTNYSIAGDADPYIPITITDKIDLGAKASVYVQLKYRDDDVDSTFKLYNQAFAFDQTPYTE